VLARHVRVVSVQGPPGRGGVDVRAYLYAFASHYVNDLLLLIGELDRKCNKRLQRSCWRVCDHVAVRLVELPEAA